jgi:benzoyl-CoA reductase/2-hydroxyglutaryl-CoA dehydratase subunit BcrC/BadD/HgdB
MTIKADYRTRPISDEIWTRMKDLRRERFRLTWTAQEEGGICVTGIAWGLGTLLAGFGKVGNPSMGSAFTRVSREGTGPQGLRKYCDITAAKGVTPICGAMGAHLGQVFDGISFKSPFTGKELIPDFVYQPGNGDPGIIKASQICAEYLGLPRLTIDMPTRRTQKDRDYYYTQLAEAIDWVEKLTKKKFDDEKLIESFRNEIHSRVIWAKIAMLMQHIPSPISLRQAYSVRLPIVSYAYTKGTVEYAELLYAEVQDRLRDGIAGTPFEKKRINHEGGVHPFYRPDLLRWPEEYGATVITGGLGQAFGAWTFTEDGHAFPEKTLEEEGVELRTREDVLHAMVNRAIHILDYDEDTREVYDLRVLRRAQDWHADAVMIHFPRRCAPLNLSIFDQISDLQKAGIIVGTYEGSEADPNEWDEARVQERFEFLYESLGLTKISSGKEAESNAEA